MKIIEGKGVFGAVAIGKLAFYKREKASVIRTNIEDLEAEKQRLKKACEITISQLQNLYEKAVLELGEREAQIFTIHQMMVMDEEYLSGIHAIMEAEMVNAEYAVALTTDRFTALFQAMNDEYMRERATDMKDVSSRLIANFKEETIQSLPKDEDFILCADDLVPSETISLDKANILAFVTQQGSIYSHTAILAKSMNIPAIIGVGDTLNESLEGHLAAVDGHSGKIYIDPDEATLSLLTKIQKEDQKKKKLLMHLKGKENVTSDGRRIEIAANIGNLSEVDAAKLNDAGGIGLFRSEFLYLDGQDYPSEETQFETYKQILESMKDKRVIIRTLDIGADKQIEYFQMEKEENPALGQRGIRLSLDRPDIFKTQLRALLRASVFGNLAIMFPMITANWEVNRVKAYIEEVKAELTLEGKDFSKQVSIGIMIETPAAALISEELAQDVDFFSIGTNDLAQYTLALDRQNPRLETYCDARHEAVFKLMKMTVEAAHKYGKWVGVCGEMAADISLTARFLDMGIDELSVSPADVLNVRNQVRNL